MLLREQSVAATAKSLEVTGDGWPDSDGSTMIATHQGARCDMASSL